MDEKWEQNKVLSHSAINLQDDNKETVAQATIALLITMLHKFK